MNESARSAWRRRGPGRPASDRFLIGAAIGMGMVARSAERGGADFLVALSAGRVRMMGAPSIACMLPIHDANAFTAAFARTEILGKVSVPVIFGASVFDPRTDLDSLLSRIRDWGFAGVANFPTAIHVGPRLAGQLERHGLGYKRELELIGRARAIGLVTIGYARERAQAERMASAGADVLCLNFGWNAGGSSGVPSALAVDDAGRQACQLFSALRAGRPDLVCMVEGGPMDSPETAAAVCRASGADGYIGGSTIDRMPLESAVSDATSSYKAVTLLSQRLEALESAMLGDGRRFGLIGRSPGLREVVRLIERFAGTDMTVLVLGANGTGKELVAQALHRCGKQGSGPLVSVNCAAIPHDLVESELFGVERGAFTGALRARTGRFEEAAGGTLFLDEIGELDLGLQAKLLRVLEDGTFQRLGSSQVRRATARIVCATNRDLPTMIAQGRFREDFYYRLNKVEIRLPRLADRMEDLPALVEHFTQSVLPAINPNVHAVDGPALRLLMTHAWPGNVRELRNVLERAAVLCDGERIGLAHLPPLSPVSAPTRAAEPANAAIGGERDWILAALQRNRFRREETARDLGISRKTLYSRMVRLGLR